MTVTVAQIARTTLDWLQTQHGVTSGAILEDCGAYIALLYSKGLTITAVFREADLRLACDGHRTFWNEYRFQYMDPSFLDKAAGLIHNMTHAYHKP